MTFTKFLRGNGRIIAILAICGLLFRFLTVQLDGVIDFTVITGYAIESDVDPIEEVLRNTMATTVDNFFSENSTTIDSWEFPFSSQNSSLPMCPEKPPGLVGPIRVWMDGPSFDAIKKLNPSIESGGHGQPQACISRHKVAIIVPYRDREQHLRILLHNLHALLTKQQLDYCIFIVEPMKGQTFNRGKLMNVGVVESLKMYPWDCFIFHDVDLMPEDDRNLYSCPTQPRHMSVAVDKFNYKLPYGSIFGGISAMTKDQYTTINGFSNDFWGWGGEDDDLSTRVGVSGYKISRYPESIARYKMVKHDHEKSNPINKCRYKLMAKTKRRFKKDGYNSVNYRLLSLNRHPTYTHILADLFETESRKAQKKIVPSC